MSLQTAPTPAPRLDRTDWLLLLLTAGSVEGENAPALDPVRIQKGMFLLSKRGPARDLYNFRPYDWGPFSPVIYGDLDALSEQGLVQRQDVPGRTWSYYRSTEAGQARAREVASSLPTADVEWLASVRTYLTARSFAALLSEIYREYPEYAVNSRLNS